MATALAAQLQAIASAVGGSQSKPRGKPSLLYEYQEAADVDRQTLLLVALQGLQTLCSVDVRFQQYRKQLFNAKMLNVERMQMTKAQSQGLDTMIRNFLSLLADHLLLPAAFQTLEYLIRAYKVNEMNVDDLVMTALPYHATNEFVRIVQVCQLAHSPLWKFLEPIRKSGVAMPREVLVQRCVRDKAVFESVCKMARSSATAGGHVSQVVMSFYAVLSCEVIGSMQRVDEANATLLLPYLLAGFGADAPGSYCTASYMIAAQLCCHATLGAKLMEALVVEVCKNVAPEQLPEMTMLLCHFATSQPNFTSFPDSAYKFLVKVPGLVSTLDMVASKQLPVKRLLSLLLRAAVHHAPKHSVYAQMLLDIVNKLNLEDHVEDLASIILAAAAEHGIAEDSKTVLQDAIRSLNVRYPLKVDTAINKAMAQQSAHQAKGGVDDVHMTPGAGANGDTKGDANGDADDKGDADAASGKKKKKKKQKKREAAALEAVKTAAGSAVSDFIAATFSSSLRQPLEHSGTTVMMAVDAHDPSVRKLALEKLDDLLGANADDPEIRSFFLAAIDRRLRDEEGEVVAAVLNLQHLMEVPPQPLFDGLTDCLRAVVGKRKGSDTKLSKFIVKKVLKLLGGSFLQLHSGFQDQVAAVLLSYLPMVSARQRKVAATALKTAKHVQHELFNGLSAVDPNALWERFSSTNEDGAGTADNASACLYGYNLKIVTALNKGVHTLQQDDASRLFNILNHCTAPGQIVLLLALQSEPYPVASLQLLLRFWKQSWPAVCEAALAAHAEGGSFLEADEHTLRKVLVQMGGKRGVDSALGAAVLLGVLHALSCVNPDGLSGDDRQVMKDVFSSLAVADGREHYQPHLATIVDKASVSLIGRVEFLAELHLESSPPGEGGAEGSQAAAVKVAALHQLSCLCGEPGWGEVETSDVLPSLLCVLTDHKKSVRKAGLGCVEAMQRALEMQDKDGDLPMQHEGSDGVVSAPLLSFSHCVALLKGLVLHGDAIKREGGSLAGLVRRWLTAAPKTQRTSGRVKATPKKAKSKAAAAAAATSDDDFVLVDATKGAVQEYLLELLPVLHPAPWQHRTALLLVDILARHGDTKATLKAGCGLMHKLLSGQSGELSPLSTNLALALCSLFEGHVISTAKEAAELAPCVDVLFSILQPELAVRLPDALRVAALHQITAQLYRTLDPAKKLHCLRTLLQLNSTADTAPVREAARKVLGDITIPSAIISPLLAVCTEDAAAAEAQQGTKKRRVKGSGKAKLHAEIGDAAQGFTLEKCTTLLELLQWKGDISDVDDLTEPMYSMVRHLTDRLSCEPHDATQKRVEQEEDGGQDATPERFVHEGYALSLVLSFLTRLAQRQSKQQLQQHQLPLVLQATRCAHDGIIRSAALRLLAEAARKLPEQTLQHVMELLSVLSESASKFNDGHSTAILCDTLSAVVSPWVESGNDHRALVCQALDALKDVEPYKTSQLMAALLAALPEDTGLQVVVVELLKRAVESGPADETDSDTPSARDRLLDMAASLASHCPLEARVQQYRGILQECLEAAGQVPQNALPVVCTAFITQQLKGLAGKASAEQLQGALYYVMQQVVTQIQLVGSNSSEVGPAATETALTGCYNCMAALEDVMEAAGYLLALVQLLPSCQSDAIQRRALRLFIERTAALQQALESEEVPSAEEVDAALKMAHEATVLLREGSEASALTQQQALICIGTIAPWLATGHAKQLLSSLNVALQLASQHSSPAVRSSALAALAAIIRSLGTQCVPVLPQLVPAVLSAAERVLRQDQEHLADSDEEEQEDDSTATPEDIALELSSALAVLLCLVEAAGAFLSPYLPQLITLLLNRRVLHCQEMGAAQVAEQIREKLPGNCPPRLLLPALLGSMDEVLQAGDASVVALLDLLQRVVSVMDTNTAAAQHEAVFRFLCRALDLRRQPPTGVKDVAAVEDAAVAAFVALTMKLSEKLFKPLFLRLIDWATTVHAEDADNLYRMISLAGVADALTERLKSLFVPYFRHMLEHFIALLGSRRESDALPRKKKRKGSKSPGSEPQAGGDHDATEMAEREWIARLKVVRALHRLFLYDTVAFLDDTSFARVLPPLVAQLDAQPTPTAVQALEYNDRGGDLDAGLLLGDHSVNVVDVFGRGVVSCITQLAVVGGKDEAWKALNQQVLMCTRIPSARTRLLSIELVAQLVHHLREEYLTYLPDTIPFLAELLEDPEMAVEARVKEVVAQLEQLSGESLEQYMQA